MPDHALRITHVVTRSHRRGAEVVALELAEALDALGHKNQVHAMALGSDGGSVEHLPALVQSSRLGATTFVRSAWRLRRVLRHEPADIIIAHGGSAAVVVAASRSSASSRVWQRILGLPFDRWGPVRRRLWEMISHRFDGVAALTVDMAAEMRDLGFNGPVWVLPNMRDPVRFAAVDRPTAAATLRQEIGVGPDVTLLGFVGHLVDQKQPELAVDVLADLRKRGRDVHLVIAGDGPRRRALETYICTLGVSDAVTLLGHRNDPELVYGGTDLVLITSRAEGIPGVAIEAQMTGCPVVTFLLGAVADVVEDGVTGAIVPWPEPILMADRVAKLLDDHEALRAMGQAAIDRAETFTTAATASLYAARFAELRAGDAPNPPAGDPTEAR